jgi:hypothetical protein
MDQKDILEVLPSASVMKRCYHLDEHRASRIVAPIVELLVDMRFFQVRRVQQVARVLRT